MHKHKHPVLKHDAPLISDEVYEIVMNNKEKIDAAIVYDRDFE